MGIARSAFKLLLEEAKKGSFKGKKILQLGRQHTFLTFTDAIRLAEKANFNLFHFNDIQLSFNSELKSKGYIDDVTLFRLLGFETVHSLDVSPYENPSIVHDLNSPIPAELYQQYDVVFDGGTLEHIFAISQAFKNIHELLKEGGVVIHSSPSHNHVDHGFYMFSPTLFSDYYSANKYQILTSYIFEYGFENNTSWRVFEYQPGCLDILSFGGFGKKMLGIWFVCQKQQFSTGGIIPQQSACREQWNNKTVLSEERPFLLKRWLKKIGALHSMVLKFRKKIRQFKYKNLCLKKVGSF